MQVFVQVGCRYRIGDSAEWHYTEVLKPPFYPPESKRGARVNSIERLFREETDRDYGLVFPTEDVDATIGILRERAAEQRDQLQAENRLLRDALRRTESAFGVMLAEADIGASVTRKWVAEEQEAVRAALAATEDTE